MGSRGSGVGAYPACESLASGALDGKHNGTLER